MATSRTRPRKTVDDFLRLPEGTLAELIDGELLMSPAPLEYHQRVVGRLFRSLSDFVESRSLGIVCLSPLDVHLPSGDIVEPDLLFIAEANRGIIRDWIRGAPDLAVEVISPSGVERDRLVKRGLYARNGIREYWLVDPQERSAEVLTLSGAAYEPAGFFREEQELRSVLLPGFALPLRPVFA